jgi:hypothetical protein
VVLRKEYNIDPDTLSDDEWAKLYAEYLYIQKTKFQNLKTAFVAALTEVISQILPDGNNSDNTVDT